MKAVFFIACLALFSSAFAGRTTLEQAVAAAWNARVADGTWVSLFGEANSGIVQYDGCNGPADAWPYPDPEYFTDLLIALGHTQMTCGFPVNRTITNYRGSLLLDTTNGYARGPIVRFFNAIALSISEHYGTEFNIRWDAKYITESEVFNAVDNGEFDAACGAFVPGSTYLTAIGYEAQRERRFSLFPCATYYEESIIWTRVVDSSAATSFTDMVNMIDADADYVVCAADPQGDVGMYTESCSVTLNQYVTNKGYTCKGYDDPFMQINMGNCNAVWGSNPGQGNRFRYNQFAGPVLNAASSFFRTHDKHAAFAAAFPPERFFY